LSVTDALVVVAVDNVVVSILGPLVVVLVTDALVVVLVTDALVVVLAGCEELPHPASSRPHSSPEHKILGLTFSAYSADIRRIDEATRWKRNENMHPVGWSSTTYSAAVCGFSASAAITARPVPWSPAPRS
jgi:hypothetical protein